MSHKIFLDVADHRVHVNEVEGTLVEGSQMHWVVFADFDGEWSELAIRVTFECGNVEPITLDYTPGMYVPWEAIVRGTLRFSFVGIGVGGIEVVRTEHMRNGVPVKPRGADLGTEAREATEDVVHAAQRELLTLSDAVEAAADTIADARDAAIDARHATDLAEATTSNMGLLMDAAARVIGEARDAASEADRDARYAEAAGDKANAAASIATQAATDLRAAADRGDFDGISPTATVTKSGRVTTVTVTDKHGTTTAEVLDGAPGSDYVLTDADRTTIATEAAGMVELPVATATTLGAVKVGDHLSVAADGTLSASASGVHVGPDEPTDDSTVWIDPSGEAVVPVRDVTINSESIVSDGVVEIPMARPGLESTAVAGLVKPNAAFGLSTDGRLKNIDCMPIDINNRATGYAVTLPNLDYATKAAMCDGKGAAWSATEQHAAQKRLGVNQTAYDFEQTITLEEEVAYVQFANPELSMLSIETEVKNNTENRGGGVIAAVFKDVNRRDLFAGINAALPSSGTYYGRAIYFKVGGEWLNMGVMCVNNQGYTVNSAQLFNGVVTTTDALPTIPPNVVVRHLNNIPMGVGSKITIRGIRA